MAFWIMEWAAGNCLVGNGSKLFLIQNLGEIEYPCASYFGVDVGFEGF